MPTKSRAGTAPSKKDGKKKMVAKKKGDAIPQLYYHYFSVHNVISVAEFAQVLLAIDESM